MAMKPGGMISKLLHKRALVRWKAVARGAQNAELATLRGQRQQARQLRGPLEELTQVADTRLAMPRIGSNTFARPAGTDWAWRPQLWRVALLEKGLAPARNKMRLGQDMGVYHDCQSGEVLIKQMRNTRDHDLAAFGITLEVFHFDGVFLSLAIELPKGVCAGLKKQHLIQLGTTVDCEKPTRVLARLNVQHGPNTEQMLMTFPDEHADTSVEFDLAYTELNEKRAERMWIDLLIEKPHMNKITFRDLNICRFPRAAM